MTHTHMRRRAWALHMTEEGEGGITGGTEKSHEWASWGSDFGRVDGGGMLVGWLVGSALVKKEEEELGWKRKEKGKGELGWDLDIFSQKDFWGALQIEHGLKLLTLKFGLWNLSYWDNKKLYLNLFEYIRINLIFDTWTMPEAWMHTEVLYPKSNL